MASDDYIRVKNATPEVHVDIHRELVASAGFVIPRVIKEEELPAAVAPVSSLLSRDSKVAIQGTTIWVVSDHEKILSLRGIAIMNSERLNAARNERKGPTHQ